MTVVVVIFWVVVVSGMVFWMVEETEALIVEVTGGASEESMHPRANAMIAMMMRSLMLKVFGFEKKNGRVRFSIDIKIAYMLEIECVVSKYEEMEVVKGVVFDR